MFKTVDASTIIQKSDIRSIYISEVTSEVKYGKKEETFQDSFCRNINPTQVHKVLNSIPKAST